MIGWNGKANICFECANACGGCSWSAVDKNTGKIKFEPIPGWEAEPSEIRTGWARGRITTKTMHITKCPQFVRG